MDRPENSYPCPNCGRTKSVVQNIKDVIQNTIAEYSVTCGQCGKEIVYWAHGEYAPSSYEQFLEEYG